MLQKSIKLFKYDGCDDEDYFGFTHQKKMITYLCKVLEANDPKVTFIMSFLGKIHWQIYCQCVFMQIHCTEIDLNR
jgi:hypothetical protein